MDTPELDGATYVRLTTYRRDGSAVRCPVWITPDGAGGYVCTTDLDSGKVKRLRRDQRVELSVSDARGRVAAGAKVYIGKGRVLEGTDADRARSLILRRHRILGTAIAVGGRVGAIVRRRPPAPPAGVEIRLNALR